MPASDCRDDQGYYSPDGLRCRKRSCTDSKYGNDCADCSASACLACQSEYEPISGTCQLTTCTTQQTAGGCAVCAGATNCLTCLGGFVLDPAAHACRACTPLCDTCQLSTLGVCDICQAGAFLDARSDGESGTCLASCDGELLAIESNPAGGQLCRTRACASIRGCRTCSAEDESLCAACSGSVPRDGGRACGGLSSGAVAGVVVAVLVVLAAVAAVCVYFLVVRRKKQARQGERLLADSLVA